MLRPQLRPGLERLTLSEQLTGEQWETPSLCAGWRVRDVAAHIAMVPTAPGLLAMARGAAAAHGNFNRLNHDLAVRHARRPTADIVAELRDEADSRRLPSVTNVANLGFDILVHGQDIAIPLGVTRPMPTDAAAAGAARVWSMGWPFWSNTTEPVQAKKKKKKKKKPEEEEEEDRQQQGRQIARWPARDPGG